MSTSNYTTSSGPSKVRIGQNLLNSHFQIKSSSNVAAVCTRHHWRTFSIVPLLLGMLEFVAAAIKMLVQFLLFARLAVRILMDGDNCFQLARARHTGIVRGSLNYPEYSLFYKVSMSCIRVSLEIPLLSLTESYQLGNSP